MIYGVDPRKEQKWASYQTAIFHFRTGNWRNQYAVAETSSSEKINTKSHLFTGKDVGTKVVCFCFMDILDPMVRRVLDGSPLREKFDVPTLPYIPIYLFFSVLIFHLFRPFFVWRRADGRKRMGGILTRRCSRYGRL